MGIERMNLTSPPPSATLLKEKLEGLGEL